MKKLLTAADPLPRMELNAAASVPSAPATAGARPRVKAVDRSQLSWQMLDVERLNLSRRGDRPPPRTIGIQACYDGADLEDVARELGIAPEELVRRHARAEHVVSFLGFAPGFAYMTGGFP